MNTETYTARCINCLSKLVIPIQEDQRWDEQEFQAFDEAGWEIMDSGVHCKDCAPDANLSYHEEVDRRVDEMNWRG